MNRKAFDDLVNWKNDKNRKPLILRGARQVGKTTLVNQFSFQFEQYIYLNLERPEDIYYFNTLTNVKDIVESLFLKHELQPDYNNTLLFIDEIQESPKAIALLRYFYEDLPELPVISAGSLLEFSLHNVQSFPVGRVSFMYLFPLSFEEFLEAMDKKAAQLYGLDQFKASPEPDKWLEDGQLLEFGSLTFEVILGPGHAPGHVAFYNAENKFVINGDILFQGSYGRVDLPGGNMAQLKKTITERMFTLPDDTVVYTGHGGETTIGAEKQSNPILWG